MLHSDSGVPVACDGSIQLHLWQRYALHYNHSRSSSWSCGNLDIVLDARNTIEVHYGCFFSVLVRSSAYDIATSMAFMYQFCMAFVSPVMATVSYRFLASFANGPV